MLAISKHVHESLTHIEPDSDTNGHRNHCASNVNAVALSSNPSS